MEEEPLGRGARLGMIAAGLVVVLAVLSAAVIMTLPEAGPHGGAVASEGRVVDPVSGQALDPATAPHQRVVFDQTYYFASDETLRRFTEDPYRYLGGRIRVDVQIQQPAAPAEEALPGAPDFPAEPSEPGPFPALPPEAPAAQEPAIPEGSIWTEAHDPPPALPEALPEPPPLPREAPPPGPPPPVEAIPDPAAPPPVPPPAGGMDDVLITPVETPKPPEPVKDEGDVILDGKAVSPEDPSLPTGPPGPAGPPEPIGL